MRLAWVELRDFRNHAYTRIEPVPDGLIVAVGPNGEGKTNLLEGMCYLFTLVVAAGQRDRGRSCATGAEAAYSRGEVETMDGRVLVEVEVPIKGASRVKVNRSPVRRKRDLRRQVRAVFFGPDDLDVVRGDPSHRRRFLDEAVVALWPLKESLLTGYDRALRQRNRLLKEWDRPGVPPEMEAWDAELVQAGSALIRARADAVGRLAPPASDEFEALAGYGLACSVRAQPVDATATSRGRSAPGSRNAGTTSWSRRTSLVGPHRDDLELAVRDLGARAFASHGEAWAAALCLRLGLATAVEREIGEPPDAAGGRPVLRARPATARPDRGAARRTRRAGRHLGRRRGGRARRGARHVGRAAPAP